MKSIRSGKTKNYRTLELSADDKMSRRKIENKIWRVYNSLPKTYTYTNPEGKTFKIFKSVLPKEDVPIAVRQLTYMVMNDIKKVNPYNAFSEWAKGLGRMSGLATKDFLWRRFKTDANTSAVYNKFNSYMYRNGYSASRYWFENVELKPMWKSIITASCELPSQTKGVRYDTLEIEYDYSSKEIYAYFTY